MRQIMDKNTERKLIETLNWQDEIIFGIKFTSEDLNKIFSAKDSLMERMIISTMKGFYLKPNP